MEDYEVLTEEITEDTSPSSTTEVVPSDSDAFQSDPPGTTEYVMEVSPEVSSEETGQVFEELLKEFIEQKLNEGENVEEEQTENNINSVDGDSVSLLSDSNSIDYTQLLEDLLNYSQEILLSVNTANDNYDVYMQNNDINADLNNISLSNYLLLLVFIALLFNAVLNFARRIL